MKRRRLKRKIILFSSNIITLYLRNQLVEKRQRNGNVCRDKTSAIELIDGKSDSWFYISYRISRPCFNLLLELLIEHFQPHPSERSLKKYQDVKVSLAATLRFIAGASYIDIVDLYRLPSKPHVYFWNILHALNKVLQNVEFPANAEEWRNVSAEWDEKMRSKFAYDNKPHLQGTVLALDGIVLQTTQPHSDEVGGNVSCNWNRKGYFALVALAAVDCYARFRYAECRWSGSTHDSTAYRSSKLRHILESDKIPRELHILADEAFSTCHPQIITPFSRRELKQQRRNDPVYEMKVQFNVLLASQRSTIERAFGMMLRKFLILTTRMSFHQKNTKLLFLVCCKLHNLCVNENIYTGKQFDYSPRFESDDILTDTVVVHEYLSSIDPLNGTFSKQGRKRMKMAQKSYIDYNLRLNLVN